MILSLTLLAIAIACRSISELSLHGKLRWNKGYYGFWDDKSHYRKYKKNWNADPLGYDRYPAPKTWYYRLFNLKYKERWPTSATFTVAFTDGYHLCQFFYHLFLSLAVALLIDISYFPWIWIGVVLVHATIYRICQR